MPHEGGYGGGGFRAGRVEEYPRQQHREHRLAHVEREREYRGWQARRPQHIRHSRFAAAVFADVHALEQPADYQTEGQCAQQVADGYHHNVGNHCGASPRPLNRIRNGLPLNSYAALSAFSR